MVDKTMPLVPALFIVINLLSAIYITMPTWGAPARPFWLIVLQCVGGLILVSSAALFFLLLTAMVIIAFKYIASKAD